jgi:hypothetical protein
VAQGKIDEAITTFQNALKINPNNVIIQRTLNTLMAQKPHN